MESALKEMIFLYHLSEKLYKKPYLEKPAFSEINLIRLLDMSIKNNIFYYHIKELLDSYQGELSNDKTNALQNILRKGKRELQSINDTILSLNSNLGDYLLIKTYRGYPRLSNDLDVLVYNFEDSFRKLTKLSFKNINYSKKSQEATLINSRFYKIHLHGEVSWAGGARFIDRELLFKNPRIIDFGEAKTKVPNFDTDFLIHIAHINFEPLHIIMSELLYLYKIAESVNWDIQFEQSKKYKWFRTFQRTLLIMDKIHHVLYQNPCPFNLLDIGHKPCDDKACIVMPISLSRRHLILTCLEKRLFIYPMIKLTKSLKILLTGDTYSSFYIPVEYRVFNEDIVKLLNDK